MFFATLWTPTRAHFSVLCSLSFHSSFCCAFFVVLCSEIKNSRKEILFDRQAATTSCHTAKRLTSASERREFSELFESWFNDEVDTRQTYPHICSFRHKYTMCMCMLWLMVIISERWREAHTREWIESHCHEKSCISSGKQLSVLYVENVWDAIKIYLQRLLKRSKTTVKYLLNFSLLSSAR